MHVSIKQIVRITALWIQVRRIDCELCAKPFRYLASDSRKEEDSVPWPASAAEIELLARKVGHRLEEQLFLTGRAKREGVARCPHCKRYQPWMVSRSRSHWLSLGAGVGFFAGTFLGVVSMFALESAHSLPVGLPLFAGSSGIAAGLAYGWRRSLKSGPSSEARDLRSMDDAEYAAFVERGKTTGRDPTVAWHSLLGVTTRKGVVVVPLATRDDAGPGKPAPLPDTVPIKKAAAFLSALFLVLAILATVVGHRSLDASFQPVTAQTTLARDLVAKGRIAEADSSMQEAVRLLNVAVSNVRSAPLLTKLPGVVARCAEERDKVEALAREVSARKQVLHGIVALLPAKWDREALQRVRDAIASTKRCPTLDALATAADQLDRDDVAGATKTVAALEGALGPGSPRPAFAKAATLERLRPSFEVIARTLRREGPRAASELMNGATDEEVAPIVANLRACLSHLGFDDTKKARSFFEELARALPENATEIAPFRLALELAEGRYVGNEKLKALAPSIAATASEIATSTRARPKFSPAVRGKALLLDRKGTIHPGFWGLPDELRAQPDEPMTVFLVRSLREEERGFYPETATEEALGRPLPGTATFRGILTHLEVAVVLWPEQELVGVAELEVPPPKFIVHVRGTEPARNGDINVELRRWIASLPRR